MNLLKRFYRAIVKLAVEKTGANFYFGLPYRRLEGSAQIIVDKDEHAGIREMSAAEFRAGLKTNRYTRSLI
jgi:hypothetical protein